MLQGYINRVNSLNHEKLYDYHDVVDFQDQVEKNIIDGKYDFMSYGSNCIVFENFCQIPLVLKICKQSPQIYNEFMAYSDKYKTLPLQKIEEIIYTNDMYIVYTQKKCVVIEIVKPTDLIRLMEIYCEMIRIKVVFEDIFFRNFGYDDGQIVLFDYHYKYNTKPDKFDILNMILNILYCYGGEYYELFANKGYRYEYEHYEEIKFKIPNVPNEISEYLVILDKIRTDPDNLSLINELIESIDVVKTMEHSKIKTL